MGAGVARPALRECDPAVIGPEFLTRVLESVHKYHHQTLPLKSPAGATLRIGGLDDTIYKEKPREVNGWGKFYLPDIVNMKVIGVVEGTSCPCDQLVLMTCEDRKVYAYDGEELHVVATSVEQLWDEGIEYPASKSYYKGEAFKDMEDKDWDEVRKGAVGKGLDKAHHKLVTAGKSKFLENLKLTFLLFISSFLTMAARVEFEREEEFLIEEDCFRRNAFLIIEEMVILNGGYHSVLVDEVLHSIFFLGHINVPQYTPEHIVNDDYMLNALRRCYPHPFECYSTQLPKRAPVSCVLEMIVNLNGQENQKEIYKKLLKLILQLKEGPTKHLVSNTFCVSQYKICKTPVRYYGVSMSTSGKNPGRIMIAASCLSYWDSFVAGAVMTYYPNKQKKTYFDGTIKVPAEVSCQAFSLSEREEEMPPCRSCHDLFGLTTSDTTVWPYGNCAEPESLSNLFQNETDAKEKAKPKSALCTDQNRERAKRDVMKVLKDTLRMLSFGEWDEKFYTPQVKAGEKQ